MFFPKQFTVGVLNATLNLAALVLVGVVGFLGSEVVLSPVVSGCLRLSPFMWGAGVGWCGRLLGLWSGLVSRCLRLSPFMWEVGVGWCGRLLGLWSGLVSRCLPLSPVVSLHVGWVLVGVVGFLDSEVVLSPVVSHCLRLSPFMWGGCWLVWSASWALKWSCLRLSHVVSGCLPSCGGLGVGWCGRLLGLWSGLVSRCLPLSPVVSLHVGGGCWLVWPPSWALKWSCLPLSPVVYGCWLVWSASWALKWSCLPLSPIVSGCLPSCGGWVLVGVVGFLGSEVVLSPVVSRCLPSCGGRVLVGVAASRTETFRDQNHRLQSKFAYCKLFGVYAGVFFFWGFRNIGRWVLKIIGPAWSFFQVTMFFQARCEAVTLIGQIENFGGEGAVSEL